MQAAAFVTVELIEGPLGAASRWACEGAGAVVVFEGVVRELEAGKQLAALLYETYEPMTARSLERLARKVAADHCLLGLAVQHSVGYVPVGQVSFRLRVAAEHRKPALRALDEFIDELKRSVPLWKVPKWTEA